MVDAEMVSEDGGHLVVLETAEGTQVRLSLPADVTTAQAGQLLDTVRALVDEVETVPAGERAREP